MSPFLLENLGSFSNCYSFMGYPVESFYFSECYLNRTYFTDLSGCATSVLIVEGRLTVNTLYLSDVRKCLMLTTINLVTL